MTQSLGNLLNLLLATAIFPLFFLPLAGLVQGRRSNATGCVAWVALWASVLGAGLLFFLLAPRLGPPEANLSADLVGAAIIPVFLAPVVFLIGPGGLARIISRPLDFLIRGIGRTVMWLLLAMAVIQFTVVILRYVFGVNSIFMQESITYMHGTVFLLAAGYALLTDDHVRVDIFYRDASPERRAVIDLAGTYLFLFPLCLLIFWTAGNYVAGSWSVREGSTEQSGIQGVFVLKSLIPAFAFAMLAAGFVIATRAADTLKSGRSA